MDRIPESALILPSLYLMSLNGGRITTSDLIPALREILKPTGEDLTILAGRSDDKFSQKVRNLRAHNTFETAGVAAYFGPPRAGYVEINDTGRQHLQERWDILQYLLSNGFPAGDMAEALRQAEEDPRMRKAQTFDENVLIREGARGAAEVAVYERSARLRSFAIEYFTRDGRISCSCCGFNFADFYGPEIGSGFIEIHHVKPVFKFEDQDMEATLRDAVKNLTPVCSNCHRMIHRRWQQPLEIPALIAGIRGNGKFTSASPAV